jgi:hypothetical protein
MIEPKCRLTLASKCFEYNPGITFQPRIGAGLAQGAQGFSQGWILGQAKRKEAEEAEGANAIILDYAKKRGMMNDEQQAKFIAASAAQKKGMIGGLLQKFTLENQEAVRKQQAEQIAISRGHLDVARKQAEREVKAAEFIPSTTTTPVTDPTTGKVLMHRVQTSPGQYTYKDVEALNAANEVVIEPFMFQGQSIPGKTIVRSKHGKDFQIVDISPEGGLDIKIDPDTGLAFFMNKGSKVLVPPEQIEMARRMRARNQPAGTPAPAPAAPAAAPAATPANEVKRTTSDGRVAIFDANTKQFLRYAQ